MLQLSFRRLVPASANRKQTLHLFVLAAAYTRLKAGRQRGMFGSSRHGGAELLFHECKLI
jgi:hypothetical protein